MWGREEVVGAGSGLEHIHGKGKPNENCSKLLSGNKGAMESEIYIFHCDTLRAKLEILALLDCNALAIVLALA